MSYDDYVRHIAQKYRLAVSIAVIKSKPENVTVEDHIQQLREKIRDDEMDSDGLSIEICSDDFKIDDTDVVGVNNDENNDDVDRNNDGFIQYNKIDTGNIQSPNNKNDEMYHYDEINDVEMIDTQDLNDSVTILQNFDESNANMKKIDAENDGRSSFKDVMELLKGIDENMTIIEKAVLNKNSSQPIHNDMQRTQTSGPIDITQCLADDDDTFCENLENVSNAHKYRLSQEYSNVFYSNNQNTNHNKEKPAATVQNTDTDIKSVVNCKMNDNITKKNLNIIKNSELDGSKLETETNLNYATKPKPIIIKNKLKIIESQQHSTIRNYRHTKEYKNIYQNVADIFDTEKNKSKDMTVLKPDNVTTFDTLKEKRIDSQETVMYTIPDEFLSNTNYGESQVNDPITIDDKYIHGKNKTSTKECNIRESAKYINKDIINDNEVFSQENNLANSSQMCGNSNDKYIETNKTNKIQYSKDDKKNNKRKLSRIDNDGFEQESQITNLLTSSASNSKIFVNHNDKYNREGHTSSNNIKDSEHIPKQKKHSKSKVTYIDNDLFSQESQITKFSTLPTNDTKNITVTDNSFVFSQDAQNIDEYMDHNETQKLQVPTAKDQKTNHSVSKYCILDKNLKDTLVTDQIRKCTTLDENSESIQLSHQIRTAKHGNNSGTMQMMEDQNGCANFDKNLESIKVTEVIKPCAKFDENVKNNPATDESCANFDNNLKNIEVEDEWTDSQTELIPFKVIEELNKVKMYLNKRNDKKFSVEGYSSDAGYRSDSQSKGSFKMSHSSSGWLNQAGHSLFSYITECPLVVTTQGITNEISVVLGQLIDKLNEEEKYPSFLEELLDAVQSMLELVYEDSSGQNVLMKKDETIQRIILLNKSIHIQKYTIEKITHTLENIHTELSSNDSTYEIKNIGQIENTCYIFHLLQILIRKYNRTCQNPIQSTQNSQEDEKILKKSNIFDIWRKKWNPNYKDCSNEGIPEKKCVLSSCSAVLNKLIVGCMEGYSLVSYFALECFNLMQT